MYLYPSLNLFSDILQSLLLNQQQVIQEIIELILDNIIEVNNNFGTIASLKSDYLKIEKRINWFYQHCWVNYKYLQRQTKHK